MFRRSNAALPPTGDGHPVRHHEPSPTNFAGPSFPSALSQRPAQISVRLGRSSSTTCQESSVRFVVRASARLVRPSPCWW